MWGNLAPVFTKYVEGILSKYARYQPLYLTSLIGFDGATANQEKTCFTPPVDADALLFGANVDFNNSGVLLKITDTASGYVWNVLQTTGGATAQGTPIVAIAGIQTQVMPILSLICPFFLSRQSKLQMDFRNSPTSLTTGGTITWAGIKLLA